MLRISNFINEERRRFSTRHNNLFAMSFSQILNYHEFLEIILDRYKKENGLFIANVKTCQEAFKSGGGSLTEDQQRLLEEQRKLTSHLHLEIESFYLFAKMLLDNIAKNVELYFGQEEKCRLCSHSGLSKLMQTYVAMKKLTDLPERMLVLIKELKEFVINYRNKQLVHPDDKDRARIMKGTMFNSLKEESWIVHFYLYPEEGEKQVESKSPFDIIKLIDEYLDIVVGYLITNRDKTIFELATS